VVVRRETAPDAEAIRAVIGAAFARAETPDTTPAEVALVDELRDSDAWLPPLSLVAIGPDGEVVGHVLCTRGWVGSAAVLALGPLAVRPDRQRRGVGLALVHTALGAADALGEPLVALLGDPGYYARFGFRPAEDHGVAPPRPEWRHHFQVRPLSAYHASLRRPFRYPAPFDRLPAG
jgi:putative acetyltransferase